MTFDNELTLISSTITYDDIGNPIETPVEIDVLCSVKSIGRTEFYNAAANGLKPSYIFVVHPYEYNNETYVEFSEDTTPKKKYKVIKTYRVDFENLELTCEKVAGNG
jgi:SPP1 family predicted phage head-tail adaptor